MFRSSTESRNFWIHPRTLETHLTKARVAFKVEKRTFHNYEFSFMYSL